ncbi:hypothetical protein PGTUg99_012986 [Puccinia graminis f. sp. tritici]|uniref:Uncharacterized protein n=1 Tax=Puccinia graminis f. sp. tritici TaxID=56615 RepID=A0A5B0NZB4_PUCGR|nr:hypothetical protein PGTUg99_012986 [Puccinia graminis f. sp. tritici]
MSWGAMIAGLLILCEICITCSAIDDYAEFVQEFNWHDPPKLDDILNPLETSQIQVSHSILPDSTTPLASASYSALHHSKASNDATSNLSTNHFNPDHSFRDSFERFYHGKSIVNNNVTPDSEANWWKDFEGTFGEHLQNSLTFPSTSTLHQTIQENHTEPEYLPYIQPEEIIEPTDYNPTGPYEVTEMHKMESVMNPTLSMLYNLNYPQRKDDVPFYISSDEPFHEHEMISKNLLNNGLSTKFNNPMASNYQIGEHPSLQYNLIHNPLNQYQNQDLSNLERPPCRDFFPQDLHQSQDGIILNQINSYEANKISTTSCDHSLPGLVSKNSETPFKKLKFDAGVFQIESKSEQDKSIIETFISIIDEEEGNTLLIDERYPDKAYKTFLRPHSCKISQSRSKTIENDLEKDKIYSKQKFRRRKSMQESYETFWLLRDLWSKYFEEKCSIKFQDIDIKSHGSFRISHVMDHFLLFLFYVDMITSIIVKVDKKASDQQGNLNICDNAEKIKNAARKFKTIFQILYESPRKRKYPIDEGSHQNVYKVTPDEDKKLVKVRFFKCRTLELIWVIIENWIVLDNEQSLFQIIFRHTNRKYSKPFFDDVFKYSIEKLNERIKTNSNSL